MSLLSNVQTEAAHLLTGLEPQFHLIAAMVWRDVKQALGSTEAAARQLGDRDLAALRDMAHQVVSNIEHDPSFKDAIGSWRLGVACSMLVQQLGKGLLSKVPKLGQDTVETLAQTAFASMVTGLH